MVKKLKSDGASTVDIDLAVKELKARKRVLEQKVGYELFYNKGSNNFISLINHNFYLLFYCNFNRMFLKWYRKYILKLYT